MNKLLQTTLITAILASGAMAGEDTGALPKTIESGATVYVNKDITIGDDKIEHAIIDNYGFIDTTCESGSYPTIQAIGEGHKATINNHSGIKIIEEQDSETIKSEAEIPSVNLDKVYKIDDVSIGKINENIIIGNDVTVVPVEHRELYVKGDFVAATSNDNLLKENDLLFLMTSELNKTVIIRGGSVPEETKIVCNFSDRNAGNYYNLEIKERVAIGGDVSNYTQGSIMLSQGNDENAPFLMFEKKAKEINMPITVKQGILDFTSYETKVKGEVSVEEGELHFNTGTKPAEIYGKVNISVNGSVHFNCVTTLKSGAILTIGEQSNV